VSLTHSVLAMRASLFGRYVEKIKKRKLGERSGGHGGAGSASPSAIERKPEVRGHDHVSREKKLEAGNAERKPEVPGEDKLPREKKLQPGSAGGNTGVSGTKKSHGKGGLDEEERAHNNDRKRPSVSNIMHKLPCPESLIGVKKDASPKADWKRLFSQKSTGQDSPQKSTGHDSPGTAREHASKSCGTAAEAMEENEGLKKKRKCEQDGRVPDKGVGKGNVDVWGNVEHICVGDGTFPYEVFACVHVCARIRTEAYICTHLRVYVCIDAQDYTHTHTHTQCVCVCVCVATLCVCVACMYYVLGISQCFNRHHAC
jgi:hypothetical protein